jgi:hypothetical protein
MRQSNFGEAEWQIGFRLLGKRNGRSGSGCAGSCIPISKSRARPALLADRSQYSRTAKPGQLGTKAIDSGRGTKDRRVRPAGNGDPSVAKKLWKCERIAQRSAADNPGLYRCRGLPVFVSAVSTDAVRFLICSGHSLSESTKDQKSCDHPRTGIRSRCRDLLARPCRASKHGRPVETCHRTHPGAHDPLR